MHRNVKLLLIMNINLYKISPFLFIKNFFVWLVIAIIPIVNGFLFSIIIYNIEQGKNIALLITICAVIGILHGYLLTKGGIIETISYFTITQYIRKNYISELIYTQKKLQDNGKYLDVIEVDIEYFAILISAEIDLLCQISFFLFSVIILCNINLILTFIVITPILFMAVFIKTFGNKFKEKFAQSRESSIDVTRMVDDYIININTIQFFDKDNVILKLLKQKLTHRKHQNMKQVFFETMIDNLSDFSNNVTYVIILIGTAFVLTTGEISLSQVLLFISYFSYGYMFLGLFTEVFQVIKYLENIIEEVGIDFSIKIDESIKILTLPNKLPEVKDVNHIEFVKFQQLDKPSTGVIDFFIQKGDKVLIYGDDVDCKTNFIAAILGCNPQYKGKVHINDNENTDLFRFGYVGQSFTLFSDTMENNICLGANENQDYINEMKLDNKSNVQIGINGCELSDGQRQRVAICRALVQGKNSILIFDHAFNMIDSTTKKHILDFLLQSEYTIIFVEINDWSKEKKISTRIQIKQGVLTIN